MSARMPTAKRPHRRACRQRILAACTPWTPSAAAIGAAAAGAGAGGKAPA
jgi:hypothetical protein